MNSIQKLIIVLTLATASLLPLDASAANSTVAGVVTHIQGGASVQHKSYSEALTVGKQVLVGDRIMTKKNARVGLKMSDGGVLRLGEETEFTIEAYVYSEQASEGRARLFLFKGAMRVITGAIAKLKERDFKLRTTSATIGVRGTDFWAGYYFSEALDVALFDNTGIYVENAANRVEITRAGDGVTVKGPNAAPSAPIRWGQKKYNAAVLSVAWEGERELRP